MRIAQNPKVIVMVFLFGLTSMLNLAFGAECKDNETRGVNRFIRLKHVCLNIKPTKQNGKISFAPTEKSSKRLNTFGPKSLGVMTDAILGMQTSKHSNVLPADFKQVEFEFDQLGIRGLRLYPRNNAAPLWIGEASRKVPVDRDLDIYYSRLATERGDPLAAFLKALNSTTELNHPNPSKASSTVVDANDPKSMAGKHSQVAEPIKHRAPPLRLER